MPPQTFSQFVNTSAPRRFSPSPASAPLKHGDEVPIEHIAHAFFARTKATELRIEHESQTLGTLRLQTESCAKNAPAGTGMLHSLRYDLSWNPGCNTNLFPPFAELFFDDFFALHAAHFQLAHEYQRETFDIILTPSPRLHHQCERLPEKQTSTSTGQEIWRHWFQLGMIASPGAVRTALRSFLPMLSATYDASFRGFVITAKLPFGQTHPRLFFDESGELIRVDQLLANSDLVFNSAPLGS